MIRTVKVTAITYPNPNYQSSEDESLMGLRFAKGQAMVTARWADIYETPLAGPLFVQLDVDRSDGFLVKDSVTSDPSIICNLQIWTDDAGLISMSGETYRKGEFIRKVVGPLAYLIGTGGTLFLPARRVTDTDII